MSKYYVADPYGYPIHFNGHSAKERRCSCRFYWTEDYNPLKVIKVADSDMSQGDINKAAAEYEK